jgi:hypothetical protein
MTTDQDIGLQAATSVKIPTNNEEAIQTLEDGSLEIDLDVADGEEPEGSRFLETNFKEGHYENLITLIDEEEQLKIGKYVVDSTDEAKESRSQWIKTLDMGLGMMGIKVEEKSKPFQGACSAHHPLLMESAVKFQSKASAELLPSKGPVEVKVLGEATTGREDQAIRVKKHMNFQITEEMTEYFPDSEKMLLYVALIGSGFKKTYYDSELERPVSEFIPADQFVVPNTASDLNRAPYYTHEIYRTKHELNKMFASEFYERPETLGEPQNPTLNEVQEKTSKLEGMEIFLGDEDKVYTLYEMHCNLHLESIDDDDRKNAKKFELASPYIVTVDKDSQTVLGIRRNWREGDTKRKKLLRFTHYGFVPGFGFYNYGLIHLLGNLQLSLTASLRSLVDAGQFSNLQGGFKLKGVRIVDNGDPIAPGEFKEIEAGVQDINKAIMRLPFGEPSQTLYNMLEFLDRKGQKFADSTEQVIADSSNYGPVGTTLALLDASTKFFSAIHKRLHNSQKQELKIIAEINSETVKSGSRYNLSNPKKAVSKKDYDDMVDIVPVSDPNISSNAHRIAKAQAVYDIALKSPDQHDMREVLKHVYINMDYDNVDTLLPPPEQAKPNDPLTDLQLLTQGKPIKAFEGQEHEAHIQIKSAFLANPAAGGAPLMASVRPLLEANLQEHFFLNFQAQMKAQMEQDQQQVTQMPGQPPQQPNPAAAAEKVAQMNLQRQQAEAQQGQDDQGEAAMLLAEAEMLNAQTEAKKERFNIDLETAKMELEKEKLELEKLKEIGKMIQVDTKIAGEIQKLVVGKGLDAQIEALKSAAESANAEKMKTADIAIQQTIAKTQEAKETKAEPKPKSKEDPKDTSKE